MNVFNKFLPNYFKKEEEATWAQMVEGIIANDMQPQAAYDNTEYQIYESIFDGEKTFGELGAPISYMPDYNALSFRSWQAFTESDLAQILVKASLNWTIGAGLKLQAEPNEDVIESEGFKFDKKEFTKTTEDRFRLFAKTKNASYNQMSNYNKLQRTAYLNAIVGGDVLCIQRIKDNNLPSMQLIDGIFVQTPGMDEIEAAKSKGHEIIHGVELDKKKRHIAYYVIKKDGGFTKIDAIGENSGRETAFLLYGSEYRLDSVRGLPLLSAVLEKIKKLDRYNEAMVASVEEAAKTPWFFKHSKDSTGVNPDLSKLGNILSDPTATPVDDGLMIDMNAQTTAIRRTWEKEVYNLPVGATMERLDTAMEANQEAFVTGNFIYICAALEIPYEVALMKYVNSFSSSRMASQSFLQILNIKRTMFNDDFNLKFYNLFLDVQILTGKIKAEGYFSAQNKDDVILLQAYRNARFTGPGVPQANPAHEVKAVIDQVEANLLTREEGIERLGNKSDFLTTIDRLGEETKLIKEKIPIEEPAPAPNTQK